MSGGPRRSCAPSEWGGGSGELARVLREHRRWCSEAVALHLVQSEHLHLLAVITGELGLEGVVSLPGREYGEGGAVRTAWFDDDTLRGLFLLKDTHRSAEPESPLQDPVKLRLTGEEERAWVLELNPYLPLVSFVSLGSAP